MTRRSSSRPADKHFGDGRLALAKAFRLAAANTAELAEATDAGNPIMSLLVTAAIAYTDALTANVKGFVNQQDHAAATKALREALGSRLPKEQETRLTRMLNEKDSAQYGGRIRKMSDAMKLLADLEKFATWAENELEKSN
jgi:microcystin degradation protein MlrC